MPERRSPSLLARWLEPFGSSFWILFLVWTAITATVWLFRIGEAEVQHAVSNSDLQNALLWLLNILDPAFFVLAAANVYLSLTRTEGLRTARRWAGITVAVVLAIAAASVRLHWPLGPIAYTTRLGPQIASVPIGLPLLWFGVILGGRELLLRLWPRLDHRALALANGGLAALTDLNLEPVAAKLRVFWIWYPAQIPAPTWPPIRNYLTWLLISAALSLYFREQQVARPGVARWTRPAIFFVLLNLMLLAAHLVR